MPATQHSTWIKITVGTVITFALFTLIVILSIPYALHYKPTSSITAISSARIIIENAQILDLESNQLSERCYILIENGEISSISKTHPLRYKSDLRINATGKIISPGLTDMHTHVFDRSDLLLNLAHGITTIRSLHGTPKQLAFRDAINNGDILGPHMVISSPIINQHSQYSSSSEHYFVSSASEARKIIQNFKRDGYDLIKIYDGLRADIYEAIISEANKLNLPFTGHPSFFIPIEQYLNSDAQSIEHVEMLYQAPLNYSKDPKSLKELINQIKASGMFITATLVNYNDLAQVIAQKHAFIDSIPIEYMNPILRKQAVLDMQWALSIKDTQTWLDKADYLGVISQQLYAAGIPMLLGSDAGAGYTLHGIGTIKEMQILKRNNISSIDILRSATINAATALGLNKSHTQIKVGSKATLLITHQDPRRDFNTFYKLSGLLKEGTYYNEKAIKEMKQKAKLHMSFYESLGWYLWNRLN